MEFNITFESLEQSFFINDTYSGETYSGTYNVVPQVNVKQILNTKSKILTNDVTVQEIPYYETSNTKGLTAIIGG